MNTSTISALSCRAAATLSLIGILTPVVQAQQVNTSAAAYGLGGNFTARATGVNSVAWNPANLGLSGNPGFSFQLLSAEGTTGLHPIDLSNFKTWDNKAIPAATRETWLEDVTNKGGEKGTGDLGFGWLGASVGHLAFQVSSMATGSANLNPDAMEALLFGNAGRTGAVKNLNFAGSKMNVGAFSTVAASYGMGIGSGTGAKGSSEMSLGVTAKYIRGNALVMAQDNGSATTANNVTLNFPSVLNASTDASDLVSGIGNGVGFDVGFGWRSAGTTVGVTVMNAVNSFKWDESKLESRAGTATFDINNHTTNFDSASFASAPTSLKQAVEDQKFKPTIAVGFARDVTSMVTLSADARQQLGDDASILIGPKTQIGAGAELRIIPMVPLRGGITYATGGVGVSGGLGLHVLGFEIGVAGMLRNGTDGKQVGGLISVVNIR